MTKLLVLSDSHGGRAAIERVLMKESKSIDALIFLGDGLRDLELALTPVSYTHLTLPTNSLV